MTRYTKHTENIQPKNLELELEGQAEINKGCKQCVRVNLLQSENVIEELNGMITRIKQVNFQLYSNITTNILWYNIITMQL